MHLQLTKNKKNVLGRDVYTWLDVKSMRDKTRFGLDLGHHFRCHHIISILNSVLFDRSEEALAAARDSIATLREEGRVPNLF